MSGAPGRLRAAPAVTQPDPRPLPPPIPGTRRALRPRHQPGILGARTQPQPQPCTQGRLGQSAVGALRVGAPRALPLPMKPCSPFLPTSRSHALHVMALSTSPWFLFGSTAESHAHCSARELQINSLSTAQHSTLISTRLAAVLPWQTLHFLNIAQLIRKQ